MSREHGTPFRPGGVYDALLRKHYFDPVVQHNVQLPGGRVLRRTTTSLPRIEQEGRGSDALRTELKKNSRKPRPTSARRISRGGRARGRRARPALGGAALRVAGVEGVETRSSI